MSEKHIKTRIIHKHDLEVNWDKATNFYPMAGELIIYDIERYKDENGNDIDIEVTIDDVTKTAYEAAGRSEPYTYERFKIGDGKTLVSNLPFSTENIENKIKITGTVTKALGGIAKDKEYTNADIADVLSDLLFPYVAPTFNSISTSASSGTFEYGTTRTVTKVTPNFTKGSKNITSVKIGTTSGGSDLYSGTSATSGTAITLTNSKTYDGTTGGTIYCTISDGTTPVTKSASVSYAYYTYYAVTDSTDTPTSWTAVGSSSVTDISITANAGQYIWIASSGSYTGICELNELSGKYNSAASTVKTASQTLVNSKNYTCTNKYNFYRLESPRAGSGTSKFKLA